MTLSPVFRSDDADSLLRMHEIWSRLAPSADAVAIANAQVIQDLPQIIDDRYIDSEAFRRSINRNADLVFVQEAFFLIFFRSVLETVGVRGSALDLCCQVNFCIQGTITAADNLFDDQDKSLLPLRATGPRFRSILELLAFERLLNRVLRRRDVSEAAGDQIRRGLLSRMAVIGSLEGSEEARISKVLTPHDMIEEVHRIRGGALFELAFVAPRALATSTDAGRLERASAAVSRVGTAFQIVDDIADFEFDVLRERHNILAAEIEAHGGSTQRERLRRFKNRGSVDGDIVIEDFFDSASRVIRRGEEELAGGLGELQDLGFWFPPGLAGRLLRALAGQQGMTRVRALQ
jgi:hypothetical protein